MPNAYSRDFRGGIDGETAAQDSRSNLWSNVGAATPEAALETLLWSLNTTNFDQATGSFHVEVSGLALAPGARGLHDSFVQNVRDMAVVWITNLQSLEIISTVPTGSEELVLNLWQTTVDGNRKKVSAKLRRVGNEWKFLAAGEVLEVDRAGDVSRGGFPYPFLK